MIKSCYHPLIIDVFIIITVLVLLAVVFTIAIVLVVIHWKKRVRTHTSQIQVVGSLHPTPEG